MKRNPKKLLAVLLAVVMVISQIPVLTSAAEDVEYQIIHQPTYDEPYVEVIGEPTGYQWFIQDGMEVSYPVVGGTAAAGQIAGQIHEETGSYDAEAGVWKSAEDGVLLVKMTLERYDEVYFGDFPGEVEVISGDGDVYSSWDEDLEKYVPCYHHWCYDGDESEVILALNKEESFSVQISVTRDEDKPIEGQNTATLQLTEPCEEYVYCAVTYEDGTVLLSNDFYMGFTCYDYPDATNPTALFTWDEYITGYQWYIEESKELTWSVPNTNTYYRYLYFNADYDSETNKYEAQFTGENYELTGEIYLHSDDVLTITLPEGFDGTVTVNDETATAVDGVVTITATEEVHSFYLAMTDDAAFSPDFAITGIVDEWVPLEGETTNTLKSTKLGYYKCEAYYDQDGEKDTESAEFQLYLEIVKNPTEKDPTVTVNLPDQVKSYQWYTYEKQNKTAFVTPNYSDTTGYPANHCDCRFDWETNEFYPYEDLTYIYTYFYTREGSSVKVTITSDNFEGVVMINDEPVTGENGVYTYQCNYDSYVSVSVESDTTLRATVQYTGDMDVEVPVEGQNTATLKASKPGEYYCVVTDTNGEEIETDSVHYEYEFVNHPTEEKPTVEVTFPELVKNYQWFAYVEKDYSGVITEEFADEHMDWAGEPQEDGSWKSVTDEMVGNVVFFATEDAQIKMDIPEGATVIGMYDLLEDGTFVTDESYRYLQLVIYAEEPFTVTPEITYETREYVKVEGQTTATLTGNPAGRYYCEVEYQDGETISSNYIYYGYSIEEEPTEEEPTFVVSSPEHVKTYQWYILKQTQKSEALKPEYVTMSYNYYKNNAWASIDADEGQHGILWTLMCQPGDKLTLNLPEDTGFEVNVDGGSYKDGVATADDYRMTIIVMADKAFTLAPTWDYTDYSKEAVADQTTATLTPAVPGYYYCVATYQDGTELESNYVDYTQRIKVYPTDESPVVEMMWPELVEKYEWIPVTYVTKDVTNVTAESEAALPGTAVSATYADGVWYANAENSMIEFVTFNAKAGQTIRVIAVGDIPYYGVVLTTERDRFYIDEIEVGFFEYEVQEDTTITVGMDYRARPSSADGVKVQVIGTVEAAPVSGQTTNAFTGTNGSYYCKITDKDGEIYVTDVITVDGYWFTQAPTKDDLTVKVNDPDDVEGYQWYVYEDVVATRPAVPQDPTDDEVEAWYDDNVTYYNGKWYAVNGYTGRFSLEVNEGDQIIITPDASFHGEIDFEWSDNVYELVEKDGSYIVTILEDVDSFAFYMHNNGDSFSFAAAVKGTKAIAKKIDGATAATLDTNETGEYYCVVTFKNGSTLQSNVVAYTHKHAYTYTVKDGVITEACSCGHSATATIALDASVSLLYTGSEIKPATVTYSEGWAGGELTVVYTNNVSAGKATASITVSGVTATISFTIVEPIPPTGEGMSTVLVSCIAVMSMAAVLALGWDSKRKF